MPPPLEASATFSFQVPTMPSSESETSLRKQEIGRPRLVPPLDRIGRGRHEPELAHGVIKPLGMGDIVGIGAGDAREHVLEAFARHQIAVGQRRLAEGGQQRVARAVQLEVGGDGFARQRRRIGRLGRGLDQILDGFDYRLRRIPLRQLRAIRSLDQLAVLIEIAENIQFADCGHAKTPKAEKSPVLGGKIQALAGTRCAPPDAFVTPTNMTNQRTEPPYLVPHSRVASRRFGLWISP